MMQPEIFKFFSTLIESEIGVRYTDSNSYQLEGRLTDIMKYAGVENLEDLYKLAQGGLRSDVKQLLMDTATNNETSFFRDREVFNCLEKSIIPDLIKDSSSPLHLNIWSAASSYGQEAISISMILHELKQSGLQVTGTIRATDISEKVLQKAKTGVFSQLEVQRGLPIQLMIKYFKQDGQNWKYKPEYFSNVSFDTQNLLATFKSTQTFDMVFCRNVLIYHSLENKIKVISKIQNVLREGGYLFLGAGESLMGLSNDFVVSNINGIVCYRKKKKADVAA